MHAENELAEYCKQRYHLFYKKLSENWIIRIMHACNPMKRAQISANRLASMFIALVESLAITL